jgi:hypothetical protein
MMGVHLQNTNESACIMPQTSPPCHLCLGDRWFTQTNDDLLGPSVKDPDQGRLPGYANTSLIQSTKPVDAV